MGDEEFNCYACGDKIYSKKGWCRNGCDYKQLMEGWTTGNADYDKIIKRNEIGREYDDSYLRWIPWNRLENLVEITKGEFCVVYKASFLDGQFESVHFEPNGRRVINWKPLRVEVKVMDSGSDGEEEFFHELKTGDAELNADRFYMGSNDRKKRIRLLGVSRQESTGRLALVAEKFCKTCGGLYPRILRHGPWCDKCNVNQDWTTGNAEYDTVIRETQQGADSYSFPCLRWIPSDRLENVEELAKGEFGTIHAADWTEGEYDGWDFEGENRNIVLHWKPIKVLLRASTSSFLWQLKAGTEFMNPLRLPIYGMTLVESTKTLALVASNFCAKCGQALPETAEWCDECEHNELYNGWTSGNAEYDKVIEETQKKDNSAYYYPSLQWISSAHLENLVEISTGEFGKLYKADWVRFKTDFDNERKIVNHKKVLKVSVKVPIAINQNETDKTILQELKDGAEAVRKVQEAFSLKRVNASKAKWMKDDRKLAQSMRKPQATTIRVFGLSRLDTTGELALITRRACPSCGVFYPDDNAWCKTCDWKQLTEGWTSGNADYDNVIRESQEKGRHKNWHGYHCLRWIPWKRLQNVVEISKGSFGSIFAADFVDGRYKFTIDNGDDTDGSYIIHNWVTCRVIVKVFTEPSKNEAAFLKELKECAAAAIKASEWGIQMKLPNWQPKLKPWGVSKSDSSGEYALIVSGACLTCGGIFYGTGAGDSKEVWCKECDPKKLMFSWTSGSEEINAIIRESQKDVDDFRTACLKWIPWDRIANLVETGTRTFGTLYTGEWLEWQYKDWKFDENQRIVLQWTPQNVTVKIVEDEVVCINELKDWAGIYGNTIFRIFGITRQPETNKLGIVSGGVCNICGWFLSDENWCKECKRKALMEGWTSGHEKYDELLKETQKDVDEKTPFPCLKWIGPDRIQNLNEIISGEFGILYYATWLDGSFKGFYNDESGENREIWEPAKVFLKVLAKSDRSEDDFLRELQEGVSYVCQMDYKTLDELTLYGISRIESTGAYAFVSHGFCSTCGLTFPNKDFWCNQCDRKQLMEGWTTGNDKYDKAIQSTQTDADGHDYICLRWIPPNDLDDLVEIGKGGFGMVYSGVWINGKYLGVDFDDSGKRIVRREPLKVAVKLLFDVKDSEQDFLQELTVGAAMVSELQKLRMQKMRVLGVSCLKSTGKHVLVMDYADLGDLTTYLRKNPDLSWTRKMQILLQLVESLYDFHETGMIHRDIHGGNVLIESRDNNANLTDYGLSIHENDADKHKGVFGVMPYVAPEVLRGMPYSQKSDIYAFGLLMWMLEMLDVPFKNSAHDIILARNICEGARPEMSPWTPDFYASVYKECVDADPNKRPSAYKLFSIISKWNEDRDQEYIPALERARVALKINRAKLVEEPAHTGAVYTSRMFNFDNLSTTASVHDSDQVNLEVPDGDMTFDSKQLDLSLPDF